MKVNIGKFNKKSNKRKIDVTINYYDTWSLDHTLAYIILPALLQLKDTKHGIPGQFAEIGGEDYIEQQSFDFYKSDQELFDQRVKEWDIILDKMIWSFNELVKESYDHKYFHGKGKYKWMKTDKQFPNPVTGKMEDTFQMVDTNPDEHWIDTNGILEHEKRIQEGIDLFAKYYRNLWD